MDWIKRNYDQFILGLVALTLLGLSVLLILSANSFLQVFDLIRKPVIPNNTIPALDTSAFQQALGDLQSPGKWILKDDQASFFISIPYIVGPDGSLIDPRKSPTPLHPPIPNKWIIDHKLDILDNNVLGQDPDGDGFTNLDEYQNLKGDGSDSTDPNDPKSHPAYYTKLRLVQYIKVPFRLTMLAWDGDPKKPESLSFQINTIDVGGATQFVHIGDIIKGTKFKVIKFEKKEEVNSSTGATKDISELTVQNTETGENVLMVLEHVANSPDSYALFRNLWNNTQFQVKKDKVFGLPPEIALRYKLIDIRETDALIETPTGQQVRVPHLDEPWSATMFAPQPSQQPPQSTPQQTPQPAAAAPNP